MRGGYHSCPDVRHAVWDVTKEKLDQRYYPSTSLKLLTTSIISLGQLRSGAH